MADIDIKIDPTAIQQISGVSNKLGAMKDQFAGIGKDSQAAFGSAGASANILSGNMQNLSLDVTQVHTQFREYLPKSVNGLIDNFQSLGNSYQNMFNGAGGNPLEMLQGKFSNIGNLIGSGGIFQSGGMSAAAGFLPFVNMLDNISCKLKEIPDKGKEAGDGVGDGVGKSLGDICNFKCDPIKLETNAKQVAEDAIKELREIPKEIPKELNTNLNLETSMFRNGLNTALNSVPKGLTTTLSAGTQLFNSGIIDAVGHIPRTVDVLMRAETQFFKSAGLDAIAVIPKSVPITLTGFAQPFLTTGLTAVTSIPTSLPITLTGWGMPLLIEAAKSIDAIPKTLPLSLLAETNLFKAMSILAIDWIPKSVPTVLMAETSAFSNQLVKTLNAIPKTINIEVTTGKGGTNTYGTNYSPAAAQALQYAVGSTEGMWNSSYTGGRSGSTLNVNDIMRSLVAAENGSMSAVRPQQGVNLASIGGQTAAGAGVGAAGGALVGGIGALPGALIGGGTALIGALFGQQQQIQNTWNGSAMNNNWGEAMQATALSALLAAGGLGVGRLAGPLLGGAARGGAQAVSGEVIYVGGQGLATAGAGLSESSIQIIEGQVIRYLEGQGAGQLGSGITAAGTMTGGRIVPQLGSGTVINYFRMSSSQVEAELIPIVRNSLQMNAVVR